MKQPHKSFGAARRPEKGVPMKKKEMKILIITAVIIAAVFVVCAAAAVTAGAVFNAELAAAAFLSERGLSGSDAERLAECLNGIFRSQGKPDAEDLFEAACILDSSGDGVFSGLYEAYKSPPSIGNVFTAVKYIPAARTLSEIEFPEEWETESVITEAQILSTLKQFDVLPAAVAAGGREALTEAVNVLSEISDAEDVLAEVPFRDMIDALEYLTWLTRDMDFAGLYFLDVSICPGFTDANADGLRALHKFLQGFDKRAFSDIMLYMPDRAATFVKFANELRKTDIEALALLAGNLYRSLDIFGAAETEGTPSAQEVAAFITECSAWDPDRLGEEEREKIKKFFAAIQGQTD